MNTTDKDALGKRLRTAFDMYAVYADKVVMCQTTVSKAESYLNIARAELHNERRRRVDARAVIDALMVEAEAADKDKDMEI